MFDTVCTLPLPHDLFTQSLSPRDPLLAVGLSSGHVHCYKLPPVDDSARAENGFDGIEHGSDAGSSIRRSSLASDTGYGFVELGWKTRRHKGSCRSLSFGLDGEQLFSTGTDGLIKAAKAETGMVEWKAVLPLDAKSNSPTTPSLLHVLTPQSLLVASDATALYHYDIRAPSTKPTDTWHPHADYISSITALPPSQASTSGLSKQIVSTGGTTLAVTDMRRGVLVQSEDQEEELMSSCFVSGLGKRGTSVGEKVVVGAADGVLTLWERGVWDDMDERIIVDKGPGGGESLDFLASIPDHVPGPTARTIVAGMGNGFLAFIKLGPNTVFDVLKHDEVEGVVSIGFDVGGRMISGGGSIVKVWRVPDARHKGIEEDEVEATESSKRAAESDDSDAVEDSSEEEEKTKRRRKKKKKSKGALEAAKANGRTNLSFTGLD